MLSYLNVLLQYIIPHHAVSKLAYYLTRVELSWFSQLLIKCFIKVYKVNLNEAVHNNPQDYTSFNNFFTRQLAQGSRHWQLDEHNIISPVDGLISQIGTNNNGVMIQAKGRHYSLSNLLAHDDELITQFIEGAYATLYLAPHNYHRVHMPISGALHKTIYVPGRLFSVNQATTALVDNIFCRNERYICEFHTAYGNMLLIMVGALLVGNISTIVDGEVLPSKTITSKHYSAINFNQADKFGHFNMGSTVIILFEHNHTEWLAANNQTIKVGELLGNVR